MENRREVDFTLIRNATDKRPRTFTELLHVTKLSRKTLNLRLKNLCAEGLLTKEEGMYKWNGTSESGNKGGHLVKGLSKMFDGRRMRTGVMLVALLASFSVSGYVLAMMFAPTMHVEPHAPKALGSFTMALDVNNVKDLCGWQVLVAYNPSELEVMEIIPGGFVGAEYPSSEMADVSGGIFLNATDIGWGKFLVGGFLIGNGPGKDGSGRLATIVFGYYTCDYKLPSIAQDESTSETCLLNSVNSIISIGGQTSLTFEVIS